MTRARSGELANFTGQIHYFTEYESYDALGLAELVRKKEVTPAELLQAAFARVDAHNPQLNAVVLEQRDLAMARAKSGTLEGPFAGVPMLLKDLGCEAIDFPTNNGSRLFQNTTHTYDSEIYLRIARAGFLTFGRTTAPEFGIGPTTEAQVYGGPTRNPHNLAHSSGGSSGGAGAAVAAGILPAAHGSDGGGSLRIPASNCGLFTLKATRARLPDGPASGEGWAGMAIDGFLTRSVRDTAALLDATHGPDLGAPYWAPPVVGTFTEAIARPGQRLRIAVLKRTFAGEPVHADCGQAVDHAAKILEGLGHEMVEVAPDWPALGLDILALMRGWADIVACGTALTVRGQERALGRQAEKDELEGVTRGAIAHARGVSGADYLAAVTLVHDAGRVMARYFDGGGAGAGARTSRAIDALLTPTLAEPPALLGRFKPDGEDFVAYRVGRDGVLAYSPFTALFNATGQPAMNLPVWCNADGLPVGVQVAGRFGEDGGVLRLAAEVEGAKKL